MNNTYIYKENGYEILRRDLANRNNDEENIVKFVNDVSLKKSLDRKTILRLMVESFNESLIDVKDSYNESIDEITDRLMSIIK